VDTVLPPGVVLAVFRRGVDAGHHQDGLTRLVEMLIRTDDTPPAT
jgi:hypothetical protein